MKRFSFMLIIIIILLTSCYEGIYYPFDNNLKEFFALPENKKEIDLSNYEKKFLDERNCCYTEKNEKKAGIPYYCLIQGDTYDVLLRDSVKIDTEHGILDYYTGIPYILLFNKITGEISKVNNFLVSKEINSWFFPFIKTGEHLLNIPCEGYYDPFDKQYKKGWILKEVTDIRVKIGYLYIEGASMEQSPSLMTQSFYNELVMILKNKNKEELLIDLEGNYKKIEPENIDKETREKLNGLNIPNDPFYIQRVLSTNQSSSLRNNLFKTAGYTIDDIRKQNFKFGIDGSNAAVCFCELDITITDDSPQITCKIIPIYPKDGNFQLYNFE